MRRSTASLFPRCAQTLKLSGAIRHCPLLAPVRHVESEVAACAALRLLKARKSSSAGFLSPARAFAPMTSAKLNTSALQRAAAVGIVDTGVAARLLERRDKGVLVRKIAEPEHQCATRSSSYLAGPWTFESDVVVPT